MARELSLRRKIRLHPHDRGVPQIARRKIVGADTVTSAAVLTGESRPWKSNAAAVDDGL